jgi:lantibiotic modifying enzyme
VDDAMSGWTIEHRVTGGDLYRGSSGTALFLAELALVTGDRDAARAARGALRHSWEASMDDVSLHHGGLGRAYASSRCARLLGDGEWDERSRAWLNAHLAAEPPGPPELIAGRAGSVLGLLALARLNDDASALDRAVSIAQALDDSGSDDGPGLAHGSSGIALALVAAVVATGDPALATAAQAELARGRRRFDPALQNWRILSGSDRDDGDGAVTWCRGATGIGLSRLAAWRVLGDEIALAEAGSAMRLIGRWIGPAALDGRASWCLCHGVGGSADALIESAADLPEGGAIADAARSAIGEGLAEHGGEPAGAALGGPGAGPGLMDGLAGAGLLLLRLDRASIPSVLMIGAARPQASTTPVASGIREGVG